VHTENVKKHMNKNNLNWRRDKFTTKKVIRSKKNEKKINLTYNKQINLLFVNEQKCAHSKIKIHTNRQNKKKIFFKNYHIIKLCQNQNQHHRK